jgi:hypothetical protein
MYHVGVAEDRPVAGFFGHVLPDDGLFAPQPGEEFVRRARNVGIRVVQIERGRHGPS